jgi:DNA-binding transcriptional LysR family regulator
LLDGAGISELPGFLCEPGLRQGRLVEVARPWRFEARQVCVTYPTHRHLPALVRGFRDFCVDYFASASLAIDD